MPSIPSLYWLSTAAEQHACDVHACASLLHVGPQHQELHVYLYYIQLCVTCHGQTKSIWFAHCTCQNPIFSAHVGNCMWGQIWLSCLSCSCALTWQLHSEIVWCSLQPRMPDCHGVRHGRCGVAPRTPAQLCSRRGLSPPEQCSTGNRTNDL